MIKQLLASALLMANVNNVNINNNSNSTNTPNTTNVNYSYEIGANPTESSAVITNDSTTTIYKKEKQDINLLVSSKVIQYNFMTQNQWNTNINYPVKNGNIQQTALSQTKVFLYMELQQSTTNVIANNYIKTDLRSAVIQMEPTLHQGWTPSFNMKAYYTYDNNDLTQVMTQNMADMNSYTMESTIVNDIYNKTQLYNNSYTPTVNSWDQVEDTREIDNWSIPILNGKTTQIVIIITPWFDGQDMSYMTMSLNSNPNTYTYDYGWHNITVSGLAQVINVNIEVIDLPNVMWKILTMPFTFISVAFNLTLWPNTPYAVDIGSLILALLGIMIFIFIMKIIIKAAAKG